MKPFMKPIIKFNWYVLVLFAALVSGLIFLIVRTQTVDLAHYNNLVDTLRDLKQVNAEWDASVLRTRTGEATDYDQVANPLVAFETLQERLDRESRDYWEQTTNRSALQRLKPAQDKLTGLLREKVEAVESFKSHNALLLNSSRFLPLNATQLQQAAAADSELPPAARGQIDQNVNRLLANAMNYMQSPDDGLHDQLAQIIDNIQKLTWTQSEAVARAGAVLVGHANAVLAERRVTSDLLTRLMALPVASAIDDLAEAEARENQRVVTTVTMAQQSRHWLEIYAAVLMLALAFLAWRLLGSFRALGRSNASLERANREIRESQVHLIQSEKMSSLGQMVAGIMHEINTPLAYVKGTISLLQEQLRPFGELATAGHDFSLAMRAPQRDPQQLNAQFRAIESTSQSLIEHDMLGEIDTLLTDGVHSIDQISDIVVNLRNFSRLDREKVSNFSVEQGLDSTLLLAHNLLKHTAEIKREYGHVSQIAGSPSQINQVFLNIITNAAHAMPAPGSRHAANRITLRTSMADPHTVRIDIQDNGKGIPADVLPKIFDPFFTTKPVGQGTGMGLSISYKIVQEHGGRILVDTREGRGTTFTILLPVDQDGIDPALAQESPVAVFEDEASAPSGSPPNAA